MINRLSCWIVGKCMHGSGYPSDMAEVYVYGLECKITDIIQVGILLLGGFLLKCPGRLLCFCLCFTSIKQKIGGLHASTHLACISIFTFLSVSSALVAGSLLPLANRILTGVCIVSQTVILLACKPKAHPNHPKSDRAHKQSRKTSLIVAGIQMIVIPCLSVAAPAPAAAGALGGATAALTLVFSIIQKKGGERA